jgi:hypothetical protein
MADLTVTVTVATGTHYIEGGSGHVYFFNGSQPTDFTFPWVEDGTVRLDQSGSSNDDHPLIFSTSNSTDLTTMRAGIISSGVTYYLDGSSTEADYTDADTFNAATTRYIEITPASATDFYFSCWVHGIGMGGIVDITQTTWGALGYGLPGWGGVSASLTGFSITAALGDLAYAAADDGWGRDAWGDNAWGENATTVILDGFEITTRMGPDAWGTGTWSDSTWGGQPFALTTTPAMAIGVTGLEATGSLGTPQINYDFKVVLTESLLGTLSLGSLSINNGADHTQGLGGIAITGSLGSPNVEIIALPTGFSATMALNAAGLIVDDTKIVDITGIAATGSLGSLTVADMAIGLSGIAITGSVGSMTVTDMQIGLLGIEMSGALGSGGVSPLHYKDVDITGNTSYTGVSITGNTAYTDIEHAG